MDKNKINELIHEAYIAGINSVFDEIEEEMIIESSFDLDNDYNRFISNKETK